MPKKAGTKVDKKREEIAIDIVPKNFCMTCTSWNPRTRCGESRIPVQVRSGVLAPRHCVFYNRREGLPKLADNILNQIHSTATATKDNPVIKSEPQTLGDSTEQ